MNAILSCRRWAFVAFALGLLLLSSGAAPPASHLELGIQSLEKQDWDAAVSHLTQAIKDQPNNAMGFRGRGFAHMMKGELRQAIVDLSKAIELDPTQVHPFRNRAVCYLKLDDWERAIPDLDQAIRLDPTSSIAMLTSRGFARCKLRQYDQAIADMDKAIQLSPESPGLYEMRGVIRVESGDVKGGMADLRSAFEQYADPVYDFDALPKDSLADADLKHGKEQLRQMLKDRPAMAKYGQEADLLYQWTVRKFAGEDLRRRIFWSPQEPPAGATAASNASPTGPGSIRVTGNVCEGPDKGNTRPFEELWVDTVFELYNVSSAAAFEQLQAQAISGELSKAEYVERTIKHELLAADKTRGFFIGTFLPWAAEHSISTRPALWFIGQGLHPCEGLLLTAQVGSRPRQFYERQYDWLVLQSFLNKGKYEKAADLAAEMLDRTPENGDDAALRWIYGCCLLKANRPWTAREVFDTLVRHYPTDADPHLGRAIAHRMLLDTKHALDDCGDAIEIDPSNPNAYRMRSTIYQAIGDHEHGMSDVRTAFSLSSCLDPSTSPIDVFINSILSRVCPVDPAIESPRSALTTSSSSHTR